jgi:hypothetical protein
LQQSPAIAFNPGLHQPNAVREKLAGSAATMRRKLMQLSDTGNRAKVKWRENQVPKSEI